MAPSTLSSGAARFVPRLSGSSAPTASVASPTVSVVQPQPRKMRIIDSSSSLRPWKTSLKKSSGNHECRHRRPLPFPLYTERWASSPSTDSTCSAHAAPAATTSRWSSFLARSRCRTRWAARAPTARRAPSTKHSRTVIPTSSAGSWLSSFRKLRLNSTGGSWWSA